MSRSILKHLSWLTFVFVLSATLVHAQSVTGSVTGVVSDPTGAVIPNAAVTAENQATGVQTKATTNSVGVFNILFLPIGQYKVSIVANGFDTYATNAFALEVDQAVKINAKMAIGATSTVNVEADQAALLNTTDGTLGLTFTTNEIATIPLNGHNFSSVTMFLPGSVNTQPDGMTGGNAIERSVGSNDNASINGNRNQANDYTLDGVDINEGENNLIGYNPAPDALAEIKVISANAPASYGNVNGGAVVSVLKSGTNQFHGSASADLQSGQLNANTWYNKDQSPVIPINPYTQSVFGGQVGGPILRNKLFFFGDYEGAREHRGGTGTASVLTSAMRGGDFSAVLTGSNPKQLYDTQNGFAPYVGNKGVPITNPVAKYLFAHPELYPVENAKPTDLIAQNNYQGPTRSFVVNNQFDVKIEYDPHAADKITAFYTNSRPYDGSTAVLAISFPSQNIFPTKLFGSTWVHTFTPNLINEARIGFSRVRWDQGIPTDPTGVFGLKGNSVVGIAFGAQPFVGFSDQNIGGVSSVGTNAAPQILTDNTFTYGDNLTWQHKKHLFSMGVKALRYQQNYLNSANYGELGSFNYTGNFTEGSDLSGGYGGADFVLDRVRQEQIEIPGGLVGNRQWRVAGYFQDDWKLLPNFTLNLGIRYEIDQPWYEANNKTANVLLDTGIVEYAGKVPVAPGVPANAKVCPNRACYNTNYRQIMPRIGFAYQANSKVVVRGGYGATSFFEGDDTNQRLTYNLPFVAFNQKKATIPTTASGETPANGGNPYTVEAGFVFGNGDANTPGNNGGFGAWPQNQQPAYIQEYNLTTETALTSTLSFTLGYIGEKGDHLADYRNANQLTLAQAAIAVPAENAGLPIPAAGQAPYTNLVGQNGPIFVTESTAIMSYNAMQATLRQHAMHGLEYTVNYTWARGMTNSSGNFGTPGINGGGGGYQNGYDSKADYGPVGQDIRNNVSVLAVYALPFGHGRMFASHASRFADLLIGGWSISGSAIAYSGFPISINGGGNDQTNSYGNSRPNQYRPLRINHHSVNRWFGTDPSTVGCQADADNGVCAYGQTSSFTFGTAKVNSERTPGFYQIDNSAFKDFHLTEHQSFGFRADIFNVLNTANYGNPDSGVTDTNFGQITSTRGLPRVMQLALNFKF